MPSDRIDVGVLFVHGIGNQKQGSLLERWGGPCIDDLATLGEAHRFEVGRVVVGPPAAKGEPRSTTLCLEKAGRTRKILFAEGIWSDAFKRPPWWRCLIWAVRSLPAIVLLFAPDHRDTALVDDNGPVSFRTEIRRQLANHLRLRIVGTQELVALRLAYRILVGVLLVGLMVAVMVDFPVLTLVVAVVVLAYLASARNVVGHVVVAASEPAQLERIRSRVRACLDWTLDRCDQVVVVAHSQGGFVCHSILDVAADPAASRRVRGLIGVGSGLKPIWMLQQLSRPKLAAAVWATTLATAIGEASVLSLLSGTDPTLTTAARGLIQLGASAALPLGALSADPAQVLSPLTRFETIPLIGLPDSFWHPGALPVIGLVTFVGGCLIARRLWREARSSGTVKGPGPVTPRRWIELSSYHDPVGRLLFPTLPPPAKENAIAVGGHPLQDHVAYFRNTSVLPWMIASEVLETLKIHSRRDIAATTAAIQLSAERRRVLRSGLFLVFLFGGTFPALAAGRSLFGAMASLGLALLGASVALSLVFLAVESAANRRALGALRAALRERKPVHPPRLPVPVARRWAPAYVAFGIAALAYCVMFSLAGYPSPKDGSAGAFILLTALFATYGVTIVAGYRPWRWLLALFASSAIVRYLGTVPPLPHASSLPDIYAVPAVPAILLMAIGMFWLAALLRPKRLSQSP